MIGTNDQYEDWYAEQSARLDRAIKQPDSFQKELELAELRGYARGCTDTLEKAKQAVTETFKKAGV